MSAPQPLLATLWFLLLGFILLIYVVLDGFDLGVGILSLFAGARRRSLFIEFLGYTWHANETWLVVLGGLLFGAFPLAYGVILSGLYIPLIAMLAGLIFRGVSLEFRTQARNPAFWEWAFGLGSLTVSLTQGFILGGLLSGLKVAGSSFAGSVWDWLNPFAALVAVGLTLGYVLLGATFLIIKGDGETRSWSCLWVGPAAWAALIAALAAIVDAIGRHSFLWSRWFSWPGLMLTWPSLLCGLAAFVLLMRSLSPGRRDTAPFLYSLLFFGFFFLCLAGSLYPYLIPYQVTVGLAAAQRLILKIMLAVIAVLLPVMLAYNAYQYRVFHGRGREGLGK